MRRRELVLTAKNTLVLSERLKKISFTGSAVGSLVTVLDVIMGMKGNEVPPEWVEARQRLTSDCVVWSLYKAIDLLANDICVESERLETMVQGNLQEGI